MKTIWKFNLEITKHQFVNMPLDAEVLTVQNQNGQACLWAMVDPDQQIIEVRSFEVHGAGNPIQPDAKRRYIATFQQPPFVWHVFERVQEHNQEGHGLTVREMEQVAARYNQLDVLREAAREAISLLEHPDQLARVIAEPKVLADKLRAALVDTQTIGGDAIRKAEGNE